MLLFVQFLWEAYAKIKFTWVNDCKKYGSRIKIRERKVWTAFSCKAVMMLKERREKGGLNRGSLRVQCIFKKILARSLGGPSAEATHQVRPTSSNKCSSFVPQSAHSLPGINPDKQCWGVNVMRIQRDNRYPSINYSGHPSGGTTRSATQALNTQ